MIAGAAWAMMNYFIPLTFNYRITVDIETLEGVKSGSVVRQVKAIRTLTLNPDVSAIKFHVAGEAVVVDLGEYGVLFALIDSNSYKEMFSAFIPSTEDGVNKYGIFKTPADRMKYYRSLKAGTKVELKTNHPRMVKFTDINDPKSVRFVYTKKEYANGSRFEDNFGEVFGQGVRLQAINIEMTDDPVRWSIQKRLPWLSGYYGKRLDGNRFGTIKAKNRTANSLSAGAFSTKGKE